MFPYYPTSLKLSTWSGAEGLSVPPLPLTTCGGVPSLAILLWPMGWSYICLTSFRPTPLWSHNWLDSPAWSGGQLGCLAL